MGYTHGIKWSYESVKNKIFNVMSALNIDRMPSYSECKKVCGNDSLQNKITRIGGIYKVANDLGLEVKKSETKTGKGYEREATRLLEEKHYSVKQMSVKYPFDLLVNENISIDVKVGKPHYENGVRWHTIGINKKYATCDLYMIFALNEKEKVEKLLIIPGNEIKLTTLNFGRNSKYDKYIDRWDYLNKFNRFYKELA